MKKIKGDIIILYRFLKFECPVRIRSRSEGLNKLTKAQKLIKATRHDDSKKYSL